MSADGSKTMLIDLTEAREPEGTARPAGPVSNLTRMNWHPGRKAPEYVARSRFQELLQSLYDAALITRMTGAITDVNVRAVEFLRRDRAELFALTIFDVAGGADQGLLKTLCENLERERYCLTQA